MKISQLEKLIESHAQFTEGVEQIEVLKLFIQDMKQNRKEGEELEVSLDNYLDYAHGYLNKPRDHILSPTFLNSHFSGAKVFTAWMETEKMEKKIDEAVMRADLTEAKIAEPYKAKLNQWLAEENEKLARFNLDASIKQRFNETTPLEALTNKLDELVSRRKDPPKNKNDK